MRYISCLLILLLAGTLFSCSKKDEPAPPSRFDGKKYSQQATGKSAHDLLSADKFNSLQIQILYMPDYKPDAGAIDQLKNFLNNLVNKPSGISMKEMQIPSTGKSTLSLSDIRAIEEKYRTLYAHDKELEVCLIYADADYTDNSVLGISYQNTSICLFGKTIAAHSGAIGQVSRTKLTATVLEHEFGHLLGLVNIGSSMKTNHEDPDHSHHCNNENCLMYYAAETTDILGFLISGPVPDLDANCLADLKANGGK
jgi:hypothetical protein